MKYFVYLLLITNILALYGWMDRAVSADHLASQLSIQDGQLKLFKLLLAYQNRQLDFGGLKSKLSDLGAEIDPNGIETRFNVALSELVIVFENNLFTIKEDYSSKNS
jgi:hypothetical protein